MMIFRMQTLSIKITNIDWNLFYSKGYGAGKALSVRDNILTLITS